MDEKLSEAGSAIDELWGTAVKQLVCPRCDWRWLVTAEKQTQRCPYCCGAELETTAESGTALEAGMTHQRPPELALPFSASDPAIARGVEQFASGIPYAPRDLTPENLKARMQRIYLPMWLVDAEAQATWQAEAGFDYRVVSHQESYSDAQRGWSTREVTEGRIRWEPRQGKLKRTYQNIPAPALDEHTRWKRGLGEYNIKDARPYQAEDIFSAAVRLPDRAPEDAWKSAEPSVQAAAAAECQQAAGSEHFRGFAWQVDFPSRNWTLLLLPVYTSYYLDDERQTQVVFMHGQSGAAAGSRRASMKRAQGVAGVIVAIALMVFALSMVLSGLGVAVAALLPLGIVGLMLSVIIALGAVVPVFQAWNFNRRK